MSEEEPAVSGAHISDEQAAIEQERVDEERETSFQFQREERDVVSETAAREDVEAGRDAGVLTDLMATQIEGGTQDDDGRGVAAVEKEEEEATAASGSNSARSGRKGWASGPSGAQADEEHAKKRARKSAVANLASAPDTDVNVRLGRLRQALLRFLDLIEHRATRSSFAKALPHIDEESIEALRQQFVSQLKEAIIDESEKLIESNELESKLASLHRLAQEADARYQAGYDETADEIKDVWRKDLDLETAISARAIPEQESRVTELKAELEQVRKQNRSIHSELLNTRTRCEAIQNDARDSLDALESAIKGLEATPDMQKQLRQTMDDLLQDLGARV